jgi:hypothetical protein
VRASAPAPGVSDRPVRLVLDTSAIEAFTHGKINVGEVIAEVDYDQALVGLPLLCVVEAARCVADGDLLKLLVNHNATVVLGNDPARWRVFAETHGTVGRLDASAAVLAALDEDCDVLTRQPRLYDGMAGGGPVIPF